MFAMVATFAFNANAQSPEAELILTQNTDQVLVPGGVSCGGSDNYWIREYVLSDYGITSDIQITGVQFGIEAVDFDEDLEIYAFEFNGFPVGFDITNLPVEAAFGTKTIGPADIGTLVSADFDAPATISAGATLVVVVSQPFASGNNLFMGVTAGETKESYLASEGCGITEPATVASVGFPDAKHVVNLIYDDVVSVGDNLADLIAVYPNPVSDVLSLKIPSSIEVTNVAMFDMLGKNVGAVYSNGTINTSAFAQGVYTLKVETTSGTLTQKVVKQ